MVQHIDVLVVGAGLSGLMAARTLIERGLRVLVLDKGASVGGRMATRRIGEGLADHGAQFFTVRSPEFRAMVDRWLESGLVFEWSRGWSDGSLAHTSDGHPRYAVAGGMNALAKQLAIGVETRTRVHLVEVRRTPDGWIVSDEAGTTQRARAVVLTPPVPQSLALLDRGGVTLPATIRASLDSIQYEPCLTAMFHIEGDAILPAPGAIQRPHAPIFWMADNRRKGISQGVTIITMQGNPAYSRQLFDLEEDDVLKSFRVGLMPFLDENARIIEGQLKRWRYSMPALLYPEPYVLVDAGAPLIFAGDAFGGPQVEGAVLSGLAAGQALAEALR